MDFKTGSFQIWKQTPRKVLQKGVLTGKHLFRSLLLIKLLTGLQFNFEQN